jgi:hypothetical protein
VLESEHFLSETARPGRQSRAGLRAERATARLCLAFSKRLANHRASQALNYVHGNLCRVVKTIRVTPAMQAGLVDHIWDLGELMDAALVEMPVEPLRAKPLRHPVGGGASRPLPNGRGVLRALPGGKDKPAAPPSKVEQLKLFPDGDT